MVTRERAPVRRHKAHRQAPQRTRVAATRETHGSRKRLDSLDIVRVAFTVGWRSITTVCWMLEQELAVGAGLLRIVKERLPKAPLPQPHSPIVRPAGSPRDFNGVTAVSSGIIRSLKSIFSAGVADIVSVSRKSRSENARRIDEAPTVLQLPGPLLPGQTGERPLVIENAYQSRTSYVTFVSSDLLAVSGGRIRADCLRFDPASLLIPPGANGQVLVRLTVPKDTPSGTYEGSLRCRGFQVAHTLVRVSVA
jgi:hypothetical protein